MKTIFFTVILAALLFWPASALAPVSARHNASTNTAAKLTPKIATVLNRSTPIKPSPTPTTYATPAVKLKLTTHSSTLATPPKNPAPTPTKAENKPSYKCPAPNSEGVYYIQGYTRPNGPPVCGFSYYDQCPYADAVSGDNPLCAKLGAEQRAAKVKGLY